MRDVPFIRVLRTRWLGAFAALQRPRLEFRKYRVAPRLGNHRLRRRLLAGLQVRTGLAATGVDLA